jgi:putative oxidoreductase
MKRAQNIATILMRLALAGGFLSAVADRLEFVTGKPGSWEKFVKITGQVNAFAPPRIVPFLAISATLLEIIFAILLLIGYKTKWASLGASFLTLLFGLAMAYSSGIAFSVFVFSAGAFLLSTIENYKWSIDEAIQQRENKKCNRRR